MSLRREYVTVDVFTDQAFAGNPLAVVLDAQSLSTRQMQSIAREFNYSETTFVLPASDPAHTAQVRIFTPAGEVPFAGHPNVGTAFVLARRRPGADVRRVVFEEVAGLVPLDILLKDGVPAGAQLTAPEPLTLGAPVPLHLIEDCLSLGREEIVVDTHPPLIASVGLPFVVVELRTRESLRRAAARTDAFSRLVAAAGIGSVYFYTRDAARDEPACDLQARMFSPLDGIGEDPATGSATAAAAALLAHCRAEPELELSLRVGQGTDMGRPSLLLARGIKRGGICSAQVGGHCVEIMGGTFVLPGEAH